MEEMAETAAYLNGDIYLANSRVRRYVMLRLEELISAAGNPVFQPKTITIEHVLPQPPARCRLAHTVLRRRPHTVDQPPSQPSSAQ